MPTVHADLPAVVIDYRDHGEADKIVTFFCRGTGRLSAIAKGAHRSKKRFVNKLELFSFLQISCSQSAPGRMPVVTEAELLNSFIALRTSVSAYQAASIIREFILLASNDRLADDNLFQLLLWSLHSLNSGEERRTIIALFLVKLFDYIGYRPDFTSCQQCGTAWSSDQAGLFTPQTGGLICPLCAGGDQAIGRLLSAGTIRTIALAQQQQPARLNRCRPGRAVLAETLDCMYRYGRHLFQREICSWKWLPQE